MMSSRAVAKAKAVSASVVVDLMMTSWEFLDTPVFQPAALDATQEPCPDRSSSVVLAVTP